MYGNAQKYWLLRLSDGQGKCGWLKQIVSEPGTVPNVVLAYERGEAWKLHSVYQARDVTRMLRRMGYKVERLEVNPLKSKEGK